MREIFPGHVPLGPADPMPAGITPAAADLPGVAGLIEALATRYAYPDRPWVRANMISSADGAAAIAGRSAGLGGAADRLVFTVLRSLADVVLVGAGTARAERYGRPRRADTWPQLRAGRPAVPRIAVLTRRLDLDLDGRLFAAGEEPARAIIVTTRLVPAARLRAAGLVADVVVAGQEDVSAAAAIGALHDLGLVRILAEGGPALLGQLIAAGLLDELCLTISPALEGGTAQRITAAAGPAATASGIPARLELAMVLQDDGFLLTRYLRAGPGR